MNFGRIAANCEQLIMKPEANVLDNFAGASSPKLFVKLDWGSFRVVGFFDGGQIIHANQGSLLGRGG